MWVCVPLSSLFSCNWHKQNVTKHTLVEETAQRIKTLYNLGCDIPGNDRADKLARNGTSKTQHDEQVSYATSKQIVQTKSRKIWHDRWARGNTGRIYYQHQQTPNQTDPINQLHRAHQTAVFRLRTHHAPLNAHLHRIKKEHPAVCLLPRQ